MHTFQYGYAMIAPNGKWVAYIKRWVSGTPGSLQPHYQLYLKKKNEAVAKPLAMTSANNVIGLAWLPNSKNLLIKIATDHAVKLAIINLARNKLTYLKKLPSDVGDFQLSPNGQMIAFKVEHNNKNPQYNTNTENGYKQLMLAKLNGNGTKVLYIKALTKPWQNIGGDRFTWSNNSRAVYFIQQTYNNDYQEDDTYLKSVNIQTLKQKLLRPGLHYYNYPYESHNGRWLAYVSNEVLPRGKHYDYNHFQSHRFYQICYLNLKSAQHYCLHKKYDHYAIFLGWNEDDSKFYMNQDYHLTIRLISIDRKDQYMHVLTPYAPVTKVNDIDAKHNQLVYVSEWVNQQPKLMQASLHSFVPHQINPEKPRQILLGKTTAYYWYGSHHAKLEGFLTLPTDYKKGHPVPMIVAVHGGPDNHWWGSYIGMPHTMDTPICLGCLVNKGFAIFRPNEHGSTSYGAKFLLSNYRQLGKIDYNDIMLGVKDLVQQHIADPSRLGIWGWSYGGFMAQWANENSNVFKAVVDGAGVADFPSLEGTASYHSMTINMGVPFWKNSKPWVDISPVFHVSHSYQPVLLQVGSVDSEVPKQQEEMYFALKQAHKPVRFIIYRGQDHEFEDPNQLYDATKDADQYFMNRLHS